MKPLRLALPISALVLVSACVSLSTLQTPRTVPAGEIRYVIGAEAIGVSSDVGRVYVPQFEFGARYGLTENLDLGGKLYFLGAELGLKYQFLRGALDAAVAPAASYISIGASAGDGDSGGSAALRVLYLHLPLLLGYNVSDRVTLGFGPKLLYGIASGTTMANSQTERSTGSGGLLGGFFSVPLRVGNAFWIAPEVNAYRALEGGGVLWQGGLAFMFGGAERPPGSVPPPAP
jgi:hypothetical protein